MTRLRRHNQRRRKASKGFWAKIGICAHICFNMPDGAKHERNVSVAVHAWRAPK